MISVSVGKVPAQVAEIQVEEGLTIKQVMEIGAHKCNFTFSVEPYKSGEKVMMDIPFLNGKEMCRRDKKIIGEVFWDKPVSDGDIILIIPKIKGNE